MRKKGSRKTRRPSGRARTSSTAPPVLSRRRKWLFRLLMVFALPLILLVVLELALRLLGVGFNPHFFKPTAIAGKDYYEANGDFGLRFFPRNLSRIPSPIGMPAKKAPGTFRIFVFGESAALGDPRPNYGAGCYLEV